MVWGEYLPCRRIPGPELFAQLEARTRAFDQPGAACPERRENRGKCDRDDKKNIGGNGTVAGRDRLDRFQFERWYAGDRREPGCTCPHPSGDPASIWLAARQRRGPLEESLLYAGRYRHLAGHGHRQYPSALCVW